MSASVQGAREIAASVRKAREEAADAGHAVHAHQTHVIVPSLGVSGYSPSPSLARALMKACDAAARLDGTAAHARRITEGLAAASAQVEPCVAQIRHLDAMRHRLQLVRATKLRAGMRVGARAHEASAVQVLDRVEDLLDLRACVAGVRESMQSGAWEAAATHVKRFHALSTSLPVPDADAAAVREAEAALLARATAEFDAAIAAPGVEAAALSRLCTQMAVLGHARMGLERYLTFTRARLADACHRILTALASGPGVDAPAAAINALSELFQASSTAFAAACDASAGVAASAFASEGGAAAVLPVLHATVDGYAARLVHSVARGARVQAALVARAEITSRAEDRDAQRAAARSAVFDVSAHGTAQGNALVMTPAEVGRVLAALDDPAMEAPLAAHVPAITSWVVKGVDFSDPATFDALLDELALMLQRCASYFRLVTLRLQEAAAGKAAAEAVEPVSAARGMLRPACNDLSGKFNGLQQASVHAGVAKAIALDEVVEDGAAGASVDLASVASAASRKAPDAAPRGATGALAVANTSPQLGSFLDGIDDEELQESGGGAGAMITSLVDDTFYVAQRAARRAFATGSAEVAATCVNHIVHALSDRLGAELEARLRVALEDSSSTSTTSELKALFSISLSQPQLDRIAALKRTIMTSTPVALAASKLAEYQAAGVTAVAAGGLADAGLSSSALAGAAGMLGSPFRSGMAAKGASTPDVRSPALPGSTHAPVARLTEEIAATSLAMNNVQLAACCTERLYDMLCSEAAVVFMDGRELAKVQESLSGLPDLAMNFRKLLDNALRTLVLRLTPRLRSCLQVFDGASALVSYELTEEAFANAGEGATAFASEFLPVLTSILAPYQVALTPPLAAALVMQVAAYVSKQLEARVRRKRFNALGALQFDADIRQLQQVFVRRSGRSARRRFTRLAQMAQVLLVESPGDVLELPGLVASVRDREMSSGDAAAGSASSGAAIGWELSADDIRAILSLRAEFTPASVAHLQLPAHL